MRRELAPTPLVFRCCDRRFRLAQVAAGDLDASIVSGLPIAELALGDALEPRPLQVVCLDALLGCHQAVKKAPEHLARDSDDALVLGDRDAKLDRLSVGIPPVAPTRGPALTVLDLLPLRVHPVRRFEIAAGMGDQLVVGRMVDRLDAGDNPRQFGGMRIDVLH